MSKYADRTTGFEQGHKATARPKFVADEHLTYLDDLRESGTTNMFGARPFLMEVFPDLSDKEAAAVLGY